MVVDTFNPSTLLRELKRETLRRFVSSSSVGSGAVLTSAEHCSRHSYTLPIRLALNMFAELWSLIKWRSWQGVAKNLHTSSSSSPLSICDHYCRINQPQFETKCYGSELAKPRHNLLTWLAKLFAQSHTTHQLLTTPTVFGNEELTDGQLGFFHHLKAKSFWQVKKVCKLWRQWMTIYPWSQNVSLSCIQCVTCCSLSHRPPGRHRQFCFYKF